MDLATILGVLAGVILIGYSLLASGDLASFVNVPSVAITLGGTMAATLINYRMDQVIGVLRLARTVFTNQRTDAAGTIATLVRFAERARREGLLALEDEANTLDDAFMRKGIQLVVDGTDPELVRHLLETELSFRQERHRIGQEIFQTMGSLAPAFGMIGTLIGLVQMLRNLDNPDAIGPGLAVALLTTFYGAVLAYLFFLPIAGKLRTNSRHEALMCEMVIEGVLAIQAGDNPRIVEQKLRSFLSSSQRAQLEQRVDSRRKATQAAEEVAS